MKATADHPMIALGSVPISEEHPAGVSVRYEATFEALEAELAKQESLSSASVTWSEVVKLASEILESHSKDLLVGVYLCHALVETEGYKGLNVGLTIVSEMISKHWEGMFPPVKRLRARKTAMQWLSEKTGRYVSEHSPVAPDFDAILDAAKLIREIDGELAVKMGDAAPVLSDLTRPLKQYKGSIQQQQAQSVSDKPAATPSPSPSPEKTSEAASPPSAPKTTPRPAAPPKTVARNSLEVASVADVSKGLRLIQENLRKLASFLLQTKITDPRPYRLSRMSVWMVIDQLPPHQNGVTQVSPPALERRKQLELLLSQGEHVKFIQNVEQSLSRAPFWLDGHRMTAQALKAIGASGDSARKIVVNALAGFLKRLPGISDLKFADGTPFADDQTQRWINGEVLPASKSDQQSDDAGSEAMPWLEALQGAQKLSSEGKIEEAIALFNQGIRASASQREQFRWRLTMADFLIQSAKPKMAVQVLEQMVTLAEDFKLDHWEPHLTGSLYRLLSEAYLKLQSPKKNDPELNGRIERNYARLCWVDPAVAIMIQ